MNEPSVQSTDSVLLDATTNRIIPSLRLSAAAGQGLEARDTGLYLGDTRGTGYVMVSLADQALGLLHATNTLVPWSSVTYDTLDAWTATTPTRVTLNTAGVYLACASVGFAAGAAGTIREADLLLSGGTLVSQRQMDTAGFNTSYTTVLNIKVVAEVVAGAYLEVLTYQDTGGSLALRNIGTVSTNMAVVRLR